VVMALATLTSGPLRQVVMMAYLLLVPGLATLHLLQLELGWLGLPVAIATSLVLNTLLAELMVLMPLWSPAAGVAIISGLSCGAAVWPWACEMYSSAYIRPSRRAP